MERVYIQRHGHAEGQPAGGERRLTPAGQRLLRAAAQRLRGAGVELAAIAHSPLARTHQTAELMRPCLAAGGEVVSCPLLAPGGEAGAFAGWRARHLPAAGPLWVVAHMPEVALWTQLWSAAGAATSLAFAPGSAACLEVQGPLAPGCARLLWLQPVEALAGDLPA